MDFESYIERNCGKHKYHLIIDLIGKYPDLYRPDLLRTKDPSALDKKAKKCWETVTAILKSRYPKLAESLIWIIWRWVRTTYHNKQCPPMIAGKIPYLDAIKEEIVDRPLAKRYSGLLDGTRESKPKRIRSRVAYLTQVVRKPFVWTSMDYFLSHHGEDPCNVMIEVVSMHPNFYMQDLESELVPCQLVGHMAQSWLKIFSVLKRSYPNIPEMTFYHAWRTLRRNFDHELCPPEWADKLYFVGEKLAESSYGIDVPGSSGSRPVKKITSIREAHSAIREIDALDALRRNQEGDDAQSTTNWLSWFGPEKQSALLPSLENTTVGGEQHEPRSCCYDDHEVEDQRPVPMRIKRSFQMPDSYYQNLIPDPESDPREPDSPPLLPVYPRRRPRSPEPEIEIKPFRFTTKRGRRDRGNNGNNVPIVLKTLNERKRRRQEEAEEEERQEREIDAHVNAEIQDLLKEMAKTVEEPAASSSGIAAGGEDDDVICLSDDEDEGDMKPVTPEEDHKEIQSNEPPAEKTTDKDEAFRDMLREKWMEFAAMESSKAHLSRFKKEIIRIVNQNYAEM